MIIAVNTRLLLKDRLEGIGRFTFEILKRITVKHREHTFIFLFDRKFDSRFVFSENVIPVVLYPPARHPFLWYLYFEYAVPLALKKYNADIFVTTDGWLSLKTHVKTVQVLHDLHYENYPQFLPYLTRKYYQHFFPQFVRKASRVVTVSNFCKNEIMQKYDIAHDKTSVVYNSSREEYVPLTPYQVKKFQNKYSASNPYFLFIGPIHPRKNLDNAIKAFKRYKHSSDDGMKLIITGSKMWKNSGPEKREYAELNKDIIFSGYLQAEELYSITAAASCLLYVSFYEGFGMPMLEAMSCHVPVIASNCSAMPEIAGDAALLVDPGSVDSILNAMHQVQKEDGLRKRLIQQGIENLKRFSWDRSADLFWENIEKTIQ